MGKRIICFLLAMMLAYSVLPVCAQAEESPVTVTVVGVEDMDRARIILSDISNARNEAGLKSLSLNATLTELAMLRATELTVYYNQDHIRPDGTDYTTVFDGTETPWTDTREFCVYGLDFVDMGEFCLKDPELREALMAEETKQIGIGCVYTDNVFFWVILIGRNTSDVLATNKEDSSHTRRPIRILPSLLEMADTYQMEMSLEMDHKGSFQICIINAGDPEIETPVTPILSDVINENGRTMATLHDPNGQWGNITVTAVYPGNGVVQLPIYEGQADAPTLTMTVTGDYPADPDADHEHIGELRSAQDPTCEDSGYTGDLFCTICGGLMERGKSIPNTGHTYGHWEVRELPTDSHDGLKVQTCLVCGEGSSSGVSYPEDPHPDGYPIVVQHNGNGRVDLNITQAVAGHLIFVEPSALGGYYPAYIYYGTDGAYCAEPVLCGKYVCFVMPEGTLYIEVVFAPLDSPFDDVEPTDYFYIPVLWALENGITSGISENRFGPGNACTRAQVVTFLWRTAGSPDPVSYDNPFTDVKETDYYYKAVLWAVENGITSGMSETLFGPGSPCTRAQVVTFLWKVCGSPDPTSYDNPFTDVKETDYYYKAVLFALEYGVTSGMSESRFGSGNTCTRGQIVTFLYKTFHG